MSIDVKLDITELLETYEITNTGIVHITRSTKRIDVPRSIGTFTEEDIAEDEDVAEGKELIKLHKSRERKQKIILRKKKKVLRETGKLECEVCGFDFVKKYGQLGYGFAECHHIVPISKLATEHRTNFTDLIIVCSNCHRMLHRMIRKGDSLDYIADLRAIIRRGQITERALTTG